MNAKVHESEENIAAQFPDDELNLEIMGEEVAEVIEQINTHILLETSRCLSRLLRLKSKCVRFGMNDFHPKNLMVNRLALEKEIGQLKAMFDIMEGRGVIDRVNVNEARLNKIAKLPKWYRTPHRCVECSEKNENL